MSGWAWKQHCFWSPFPRKVVNVLGCSEETCPLCRGSRPQGRMSEEGTACEGVHVAETVAIAGRSSVF